MVLNIESLQSKTTTSLKCPICGFKGNCVKSISSDEIKRSLSDYFSSKPSDDFEVMDCDIFKCENCTLEYADPFVPGSDSFYNWVTTREDYYPSERWEWKYFTETFRKAASI